MDKDPETLEEALKVIKGWKRLYGETLAKLATARAEALKLAVLRVAKEKVNAKETMEPTDYSYNLAIDYAINAILADKQEEE